MVTQRAASSALIIEATIALLRDHDIEDITVSKVAEVAGISRTSVYKFFPDASAIFKVIADRMVTESFKFILEYARHRNPLTIEAAIEAVVDGSCVYFERHPEGKKTILGNDSRYQILDSRNEFDKLAASMYYELLDMEWPFERLSDEDPFRSLALMQSALFSVSIQRLGTISASFAAQAKLMGCVFISASLSQMIKQNSHPDLGKSVGLIERSNNSSRLDQAATTLRRYADDDMLRVAAEQLESLVKLYSKKRGEGTYDAGLDDRNVALGPSN